ncbi:ABC transporter ATP-binding protein/permease [Bacteroidia bacterium]|nr:ABC transporter ATP-binding protein/permease [Bacteroidia bacterium]
MKLIKYLLYSFHKIANPRDRKRAKKALLLSFFQSIADVVGLAAIVPVLMLAIDGDFLEKSSKLRYFYKLFHFKSEAQFLIVLIIAVFIFFVLKNTFSIWLQVYIKKTAAHVVAKSTQLKYKQFVNKDYHEIITKGTPDFVNLVMNVPYHYATGMLLPFVNLFSEVVVIILFAFFIIYNPMVFLIVLIILAPAVYLINKSIKSRIVNIGVVSGELREEALEELNLGISGITEIKLNKVSGYFIANFVKKQYAYARNEMKSLTVQAVPSRILEIIALLGVIILVIYGYFFSTNPSEVRVLGALFVISIFRLIPAINRVLVSLMHIKIYKYTADELLKSATYVEQHSSPITFNDLIEISNLSYTYPGSDFELFKQVNLSIRKGELIGLTGASGSGKSTLVKILLRLYKADSGKIMVDGEEISDRNELSWQQLIGYVGQQPYILKGTIAENVALAEVDDLNEGKIIESLTLAGLHDFANQNMLSYNVGEGGIKISEGQKQRLAIARVIYKGNKIIILDESTSALDEETERKVLETLKELANNTFSILIIAHRKSILEACNRVYQLENGTN